MFILIPLLLILGSAIGIVVIVYPKLPYLRKLSPEAHTVGASVLHDFFPELTDAFNHVKIKGYEKATLRELEKLLRRLRVAMMKIDHLSERLIKQVRKVHLSAHIEHAVLQEQAASLPEPVTVGKTPAEIAFEELKAAEQKLIIEIAKNPKDPQLYEALGDLYLKMNSPSEAKESYEAALELNPSDISLAKKYSKLLHASA